MTSLPLVPWPDAALPAVRQVTAHVEMTPGHLFLRFALEGEIDALLLPAPAVEPQAQDGLWQHTCFEAFVGDGDSPRYAEFNFSPSGCWAGYAFSRPRVRAASSPAAAAPSVHCRHDRHTFGLDARIDIAALGVPVTPAAPIGLSAVLEERDGHLTYWALSHPGAKPDFHDRRGWSARTAALGALE